ncbi:hypothetical protein [Lentibacillus salinarum]|uniref:Uncharacterized protein n=1 Tax=Lentibacillus salinarum TaxID=446820 RepID=A0ABW3ZX32_9BACI
MKWKNPPHSGKYKLVATKKHTNDIGLIVLGPDRREYSWNSVSYLPDGELKDYLLSMKDDIESGAFDIELLDQELEG